jgi:uncharacterized protein (TIGR02996 family)
VETAFLKRITDEPDDVVARLVFADWLREQDDPVLNERGEFIHLQHALAEGNVAPEDRPKLVSRQKELLERHRERWEESFRGLVGNCEYRTGFAERMTLRAEQFVDNFGELVERTPVVRVRLSGLTPDTVSFVTAVEALTRLRELDLSGTWVTAEVLGEFLASPRLTRLRSLNLARTHTGDEGVRALVASNVFRRLRYLNLSDTNLTTSGVHALVNAIYNRTPALQMLVLRGAPRLQPGAFPPVPPGLPFRLRQSLQAQIGLDQAPPQGLLARLHASRATLSGELRRWVEWLHTHGQVELPRAVKALPLPEPLRAVFTLVCHRRVVWRAKRLGSDLTALPLRERRVAWKAQELGADSHGLSATPGTAEDLAETVRILIGMIEPEKEARALVGCLLDLYLRHERGELPADGKTRLAAPQV